MVLDKLGESLRSTLNKIAQAVFVDDTLLNEVLKDIQRALLQSDTNVQLVLQLTQRIKERAKKDVPSGMTVREHLLTVVYEELTAFLGKEGKEIKVTKKPTTLLLVGLFGSGKTTTAGKLARFYKKRGYQVALVQTDTWRPAAYDQLQQLAQQVGVDFYGEKKAKDPVAIYQKYHKELQKYDVVLIDTAGRDALSDDLIAELRLLHEAVQADERLLVLSADLGQAAQKQAETFHDTCGITGVIITKLEGTAKGGGALTACAVTQAPVIFIGVGEKIDDLEVFHPQRFVSRLLGMGDLESLLEKAREVVSEEKAEDLSAKFMSGKFSLIDLYDQMTSLKKMGSLKKIMEMIPGMSQLKLPKELIDVQEGKLEKWKYCMQSMPQEELEDPEVLSGERSDRVAKGAGITTTEVRELLTQYKHAQKMMKMFKGEQDMGKLMKKMGGKLPKGMLGM